MKGGGERSELEAGVNGVQFGQHVGVGLQSSLQQFPVERERGEKEGERERGGRSVSEKSKYIPHKVHTTCNSRSVE